MRENLCSIPVNEGFEPRCGCPICRLADMLEQRMVDYIMGAAMMEPDVRIETNRLGFCHNHLQLMREKGNRLSLALQLETRLMEIKRSLGKENFKKGAPAPTCFVCGKIEEGLKGFLTTVCRLYEKEEDFRTLYTQQEFICYPHYLRLCETAEKRLPKKPGAEFRKQTELLAGRYLDSLQQDLRSYCELFDYRSQYQKEVSPQVRDAIERTVLWMTSKSAK